MVSICHLLFSLLFSQVPCSIINDDDGDDDDDDDVDDDGDDDDDNDDDDDDGDDYDGDDDDDGDGDDDDDDDDEFLVSNTVSIVIPGVISEAISKLIPQPGLASYGVLASKKRGIG